MNEQLFKQQLELLSEAEWQSLVEGKGLLIKDDFEIIIGKSNAPNLVFSVSEFTYTDVSDLKKQVLNGADLILVNYYQIHPLTLKGFNYQIDKLVEKHGFATFCAPIGKISNRTLFVDGGEVIAEPADSPRHQYGVFYEIEKQMSDKAMSDSFQKWLSSGEAHQRYLGMNVCRYNC